MVAKQGEMQTWHFAHYRTENCKAGYESALHLAVKRILEEERQLLLPPCGVVRHPIPINGLPIQDGDRNVTLFDVFEYTATNAEALVQSYAKIPEFGFADLPSRLVRFDDVLVEKAEGDIRPDIVGIVGDRPIYIEVAVTHYIDKVKLARVRDRGVATLEIAISPETPLDWEGLRTMVLSHVKGKYWRFNPRVEKLASACYEARRAEAEKAALNASKKSAYERRYKASHEAIFRGRGSIITIQLSPSHVTCKIDRSNRFSEYIAREVAKRHRGRYNETMDRWEFDRGELIFFEIAKWVKRFPGFELARLLIPEANAEQPSYRLGASALRRAVTELQS